ncbi:hypothetical protein [uncultured Alteromonas sp.]|uniref:hypothetical protein n=1 Tax=uncultured Alteromonas sp. TaxID=179113 RepID=UPI0030DA4D12
MKFFTKILVASAFLTGLSSAQAAFINFDDYAITGYANQDQSGSANTSDSGLTLDLAGNTWVNIMLDSTITSTSILNFTFEATGLNAELYGFMFDNNNSFELDSMEEFGFVGGTQSTASVFSTSNVFDDYVSGDGVVSYSISIGDFFTGTFDRLVFILDNDASASGSFASFTNVEICDSAAACTTNAPGAPTAVSSPSHLGFIGLSLFAIAALRRKAK